MQNASDHMEKANKEFFNKVEEASSFSRNNLDAAVQAANIMADGMKDVSQAVFNHMQQSVQNAMATGKAMLAVKTMRELMDLQSEYVRSTMDTLMAESTKISEITVRCTSEAAEPINARVHEVVEKISDRARKVA